MQPRAYPTVRSGSLTAGTVTAALGVLGQLVAATTGAAVTVLIYTSDMIDPGPHSAFPAVMTFLSALAFAGLLTSVSLLINGHDAGRSATVWLGVVTMPWTLLTAVILGAVAVYGFYPGEARLAAALGVLGAGLALLAQPIAAVLLVLRGSRRPMTGSRAAPGRFWAALGLATVAVVGLVLVWPFSATGQSDQDPGDIILILPMFLVLVGIPLAVAGVRAARAVVSRAFGGIALFFLPFPIFLSLWVGVDGAVADVSYRRAALLSPAVTDAAAGVLVVGFVAAIGLVVTGLATLRPSSLPSPPAGLSR